MLIRRPKSAKDLFKLGAHRKVQRFSAWQFREEPSVVSIFKFAGLCHLMENPVYHLRELRIVLAEHNSVRVVRKEFPDDGKVVRYPAFREQAPQQYVIAGECV